MEEKPNSPHILIFPLPVQGHVNSMLKLAELLSKADFKVTFLKSEHNYQRLVSYTNISTLFEQYPLLQFKIISDALAMDQPQSSDRMMKMFDAISLNSRPLLNKTLIKTRPPIGCIIRDEIMGFMLDIAEELKTPIINFCTIGACWFWAYYCILEMIQASELPMQRIHNFFSYKFLKEKKSNILTSQFNY